jgi:hypothetical protein
VAKETANLFVRLVKTGKTAWRTAKDPVEIKLSKLRPGEGAAQNSLTTVMFSYSMSKRVIAVEHSANLAPENRMAKKSRSKHYVKPPEIRNSGSAVPVYKALADWSAKNHCCFRSDDFSVSVPARRVWLALARRGYLVYGATTNEPTKEMLTSGPPDALATGRLPWPATHFGDVHDSFTKPAADGTRLFKLGSKT